MSDTQQMRVWWIPQVPMKAFYVPVHSVDEARKLHAVLAEYDKFQFENKVKPDHCNVGGLEVWEELDGKWQWCEWEDEDGHSISDIEKRGTLDMAIDAETKTLRQALESVYAGVPDSVRRMAEMTSDNGVQQIPILTGTIKLIRAALGKDK